MGSVKVSVIVPIYNRSEWLPLCLSSIKKTNYPNLEVVAIDDASDDKSIEVLRDWVAEHSFKESVVICQHPENRGVAAARNTGIAQATGEYLCFLDPDDVFTPDRFERCVNILNQNSVVDAVVERVDLLFESDMFEQAWGKNPHIYSTSGKVKPEEFLRAALIDRTCYLHTPGLIFRRSLLSKTGIFDENIEIGEDYHFWLRVASTGYISIGKTDSPIAFYRRHKGNTWEPGEYSAFQDFTVIMKVLNWAMNSSVVHRDTVSVLTEALKQKALNCVVIARTSRFRPEAFEVVKSIVMHRRWNVMTISLLKNLIYLIVNK